MALTQNDAQMIADAVMRGIRQAGGFGSDRSGDTSFTRDTSRKSRPRNTDVDAASDEMIKSLENLSSSYDSVTLRWKRSLNNSANWVIGSGLKKAQKEYVDSLDAISDASKGSAKDIIKSFSDFVKNNSKNFDEQQKLFNKLGDYNKIANKLKKELKSADKTEKSVKKLQDELNGVAGDLKKYGVSVDDITLKVKANGQVLINNSNVLKGMLDANQKLQRETRQHVDRTKELHRKEIDARMKMIAAIGTGFTVSAKRYANSIESRLLNQQANRRLGTTAKGYGVGESTVYEFLRSNINVGASLGGSDKLLDSLDKNRMALNRAGFFGERAFEGLGKIMDMEFSAGIMHTEKSTNALLDIVAENMQFTGMSRDDSMAWLAEEMKNNQSLQIRSIGKTDEEQLEILEEMLVASRITARQSGLSANFLKDQHQVAMNMRHASVVDALQKGIINSVILDSAKSIANEQGEAFTDAEIALLHQGMGPNAAEVIDTASYQKANEKFFRIMGRSARDANIRAYDRQDLGGGQLMYDVLQPMSSAPDKARLLGEELSIRVTSEAARAAEISKQTNPEYQGAIQDSRDSFNVFDLATMRFKEAVDTFGKAVLGAAVGGIATAAGGYLLKRYGGKLLGRVLGRAGSQTVGQTARQTVGQAARQATGHVLRSSAMSSSIPVAGGVSGLAGAALTLLAVDKSFASVRDRTLNDIKEEREAAINAANTTRKNEYDALLERATAAGVNIHDKDALGQWVRSGEKLDPTQRKIEEHTEETRDYLKKIYETSVTVGKITPASPSPSPSSTNKSASLPLVQNISPVSANTGGLLQSRDDLMKGTYDAFRKQGLSHTGALAMLGEIGREGSFRAENMFGSHTDDSNSATNVGIISWQKDRKDAVLKRLSDAGLIDADGRIINSQASLDVMAEHLMHEMSSGQVKDLTSLLARDDISPHTMMDEIGKYVIKWRIDDSKYGPGGIRNRTDFFNLANSLIPKDSSLNVSSSSSPTSWDSGTSNHLKAITSGRSLDEDGNLVDISDSTPELFGTLIDTVAQVRDKVQENTTNREDVNNENRNFSQYETKQKQSARRIADALREEFSNSVGAIHSAYANIDNTL